MINPFAGPRPIAQGEPLFGRNREIAEMRQLLVSERLVLLHSPSGAGKTSLLNAGIVPEFEDRFDICPPTRVNFEMPYRYEDGPPVPCSAVVGATPKTGESIVERSFPEFANSLANGRNTLLIFDHFEQTVRTTLGNLSWHAEFFRQLGMLLANPTNWAVFALREDYLAPVLPILDFLPTRLRARYRLDFLTLPQSRQVMRQTARVGNREFTDRALTSLSESLATVLVQNAGGWVGESEVVGETIEPLQLQVVCRRLIDGMEADDVVVDPEDVERFGDVTTALGAYYRDCVEQVAGGDPLHVRSIREWFENKLLTPGGYRGQVQLGEERSGGLENRFIESMLETHLVRAEIRRGFTWYELAHDSLIKPVRSDNKRWFDLHLGAFQRRASQWVAMSQADALLLTESELREAKQWAATPPNGALATTEEWLYLERSAAKLEAAAREAAQMRALRAALVRVQLQEASRANAVSRQDQALARYAAALRVDPLSAIEARTAIACHLRYLPFGYPVASGLSQAYGGVGAISADGQIVAVLSGSVVEVKRGSTGEVVFAYRCQSEDASIALNGNGSMLLIAYADGSAQFVPMAADSVPEVAVDGAMPATRPRCASFAPDGAFALTVSADGVLRRWHVGAGELTSVASSPIVSAAFVAGTLDVLTVSEDGTFLLWPAAGGSAVEQSARFPGNVKAASFHGLAAAVVVDVEERAYLWRSASAAAVLLDAGGSVREAVLSSDGRYAVLVSLTGEVTVWDTATASRAGGPLLPGNYARGIVLSANDWLFPVDIDDPWTYRVDPQSLVPRRLRIASPRPTGVATQSREEIRAREWVSPDGAEMVALSPDGECAAVFAAGSVRLFDTATGESGETFDCEPPSGISFSPDGQWILIRQVFSRFWLWNRATGEPPGEAMGADEPVFVQDAVFAPDSGSVLLLSRGDRASVAVWTIAGVCLWRSPVVDADQRLAAWSPAGDLVLTAGAGGARLWDAQTGERLGPPMRTPSDSRIRAAAFAPEGRRLAIATEDGMVQIFETGGSEPISPPFPHSPPVLSVAFDPSGRTLISCHEGGTVTVREILQDDGTPESVELLAALAEAVGGVMIGVRGFLRDLPDPSVCRYHLLGKVEGLSGELPDFIRSVLVAEAAGECGPHDAAPSK